MPLYTIIATRETLYEFNFEAEDEASAIEKVNYIELNHDVEEYAYDWYPLEITEINEEENNNGSTY
jgi:hypothetical protein